MKLGVNAVRLTRPFTGVGRYLECVLREWAKAGTPFDEVILYAPSGVRRDLVELPLEGYRVKIVGSPGPDPFWEWRSLRLAARREVDVLFCPSYTIPMGYSGRCAVTYLGPAAFPRWDLHALRGAAYDRIHRYSARRADHVFTCSSVVKARVVEVFGVPSEHVSVTYLAASELFAPVRERHRLDSARAAYVGSDGPFLLYVGKLSGRHFIPELLEGFADAVRRSDLAHLLVLAGPDEMGYDVPGYARRLGMADRIRWVPFVPHRELPPLYTAADAFLFPTCEAEGFGIPVLEAMACGTPVISVDQGSISEFARGSALLVSRPTRAELSAAIRQLTRDEELRRRLRTRGLETAARITWKFTADKTIGRLWDLAQRRRGAG